MNDWCHILVVLSVRQFYNTGLKEPDSLLNAIRYHYLLCLYSGKLSDYALAVRMESLRPWIINRLGIMHKALQNDEDTC